MALYISNDYYYIQKNNLSRMIAVRFQSEEIYIPQGPKET